MRSVRISRRVPAAPIFAGLLLALTGCSAGKPEGTVSGTVKYKGAPVTVGTVNFFSAEKGSASEAPLDGSGNFKLAGGLEVGTYKVYIQPPIPEQLPPGKAPKSVARLTIPPKYQDLGQTPVTREVKEGPNTFVIELE